MTMVEKVARAICGAQGYAPEDPSDLDRKMAVAALKALRDPTPEMVEAGLYAVSGAANTGSINHLWQTMIDSALSGEREGKE